jgi:hypothetical protein
LPTPGVRVPRHVALFVTRPVVDYFSYAVRPGVSARRAAHRRLLRLRRASGSLSTLRGSSSAPARRAARHAARRRLLRLRRASGCLGTSRGSSSTTSPTPHIRVPRLITRLIVD